MRICAILAILALVVTASLTLARPDEKANAGKVLGAWTGTWGPFAPFKEGEQPKPYTAAQRQIDCKVEMLKNGDWQATFEGECGRPYKYTIKMLGRQSGEAVLFKGTTDLGEKDGGVYDWIGRATETGFVG